MKKHLSILLTLALLAAMPSPGLETAGLHGGVACFAPAGTGADALALAGRERWLVVAVEPDAAKAQALRDKAMAAGLYGRTFYVHEGPLDHLPLADNYVDLLVAEKESPENLRVLTPVIGRALIGGKTISKPELPGSDWWTHRLHGPDNNFASRDTAFQWPPILQFQAMPMHRSFHGASFSAPGRNVEMYDWTVKQTWFSHLTGALIVRNSYNGQVLWRDLIPEGIEPMMPIAAVTADTLYIATGDRAAVLPRALADGKPGTPIELGGADRRIRWLAIADGVLYTLSGPNVELRKPYKLVAQPAVQQEQQQKLTLLCDTFATHDLKSGTTLWTCSEPAPVIDFKSAALSQSRLIFYVEGKRLTALDAKNGKEVWRNEGADWIAMIKRPPKPHNWNVEHTSYLTVGEGLIRFTPLEARVTLLFKEADGTLIKSEAHRGNLSHAGQKEPIVRRDGKIFLGLNEIDPATGQQGAATLPAPIGTAFCGIATYAPGIGMMGHCTADMKTPCGVGSWAAGGLLHYFSSQCECGTVPGNHNFASGGEILARAKDAPEHPLAKGAAFAKKPALIEKAGDWIAYRGNIRHTGASAAQVGATAAVAWTWKPAKPFAFTQVNSQHTFDFDERPVPPIVAAGHIFTAASDGVVRAHQMADGKPVWERALGGGVFTSPVMMGGRLFVPCLDGSVYALDAASGDLVWQRRLAPLERRILIFGELASTWPVLALMADGGRVYAAAGYRADNGGVAFCLDGATGEIVWRRHFEPVYGEEAFAFNMDRHGFGGQITKVKDRIWLAGLKTAPLVLDAATGEPAAAPADDKMKYLWSKGHGGIVDTFKSIGQEIVNVDDRAVLVGGSMLFENHNMRDGKNSRTNFKLMLADDQGRLLLDVEKLPVSVLEITRLAPAYDDGALCFVARYEKASGDRKVEIGTIGLNLWDKAAFLERSRALQKGSPVTAAADGKGRLTLQTRFSTENLPYSEGRWTHPETLANAVALSADAMLVAEATGWARTKASWGPPTPEGLFTVQGWQLTAYDRANGNKRWSVPLPSEPLFNGLAVAADGTVVVVLRDGSFVAVKG